MEVNLGSSIRDLLVYYDIAVSWYNVEALKQILWVIFVDGKDVHNILLSKKGYKRMRHTILYVNKIFICTYIKNKLDTEIWIEKWVVTYEWFSLSLQFSVLLNFSDKQV